MTVRVSVPADPLSLASPGLLHSSLITTSAWEPCTPRMSALLSSFLGYVRADKGVADLPKLAAVLKPATPDVILIMTACCGAGIPLTPLGPLVLFRCAGGLICPSLCRRHWQRRTPRRCDGHVSFRLECPVDAGHMSRVQPKGHAGVQDVAPHPARDGAHRRLPVRQH